MQTQLLDTEICTQILKYQVDQISDSSYSTEHFVTYLCHHIWELQTY